MLMRPGLRPTSSGLGDEGSTGAGSSMRLESHRGTTSLRHSANARSSSAERSFEVEGLRPLGKFVGRIHELPLRLRETEVIQQPRELDLALHPRERVRGGNRDLALGVETLPARREEPGLFVGGQEDVEGPLASRPLTNSR
jgi:hypothetical protein